METDVTDIDSVNEQGPARRLYLQASRVSKVYGINQ